MERPSFGSFWPFQCSLEAKALQALLLRRGSDGWMAGGRFCGGLAAPPWKLSNVRKIAESPLIVPPAAGACALSRAGWRSYCHEAWIRPRTTLHHALQGRRSAAIVPGPFFTWNSTCACAWSRSMVTCFTSVSKDLRFRFPLWARCAWMAVRMESFGLASAEVAAGAPASELACCWHRRGWRRRRLE